ncbi:hypothetical protein Y032_0028g1741 [Ancylostoma ceylanicum]|uniref:Uncharacterized protein n=1 Tax=Ancylostoma ceylanicum TaxID=53326 RepID=A0A016USQ3_9BILA|nr:hypothetical protein Y032_0028g1741 [Ancylostoma ceylanicum]
MKFLGALLILVACLAYLASSTPVRVKRQWGGYPPYNYGPYPNYGYGGGWYGSGYYRRPTIIKKTTIYRPG